MPRRLHIQTTDVEDALAIEILKAGTAATAEFCHNIGFTPGVTNPNDMMPLWFLNDKLIKRVFVYLRYLAGDSTVVLHGGDIIHQIASMIKPASQRYREEYVSAWRHLRDSVVADIRAVGGIRYVCEAEDNGVTRCLWIRAAFDLEIRLKGEGEYYRVRDAELPVHYVFSSSEALPSIDTIVPPEMSANLTATSDICTDCTGALPDGSTRTSIVTLSQ